MPEKTLYFVQPFGRKRDKLVGHGAVTFLDAAEALAVGAAMARRRAGVLVLAQSFDPARQMLGRPSVLRRHGDVPGEWLTERQAA